MEATSLKVHQEGSRFGNTYAFHSQILQGNFYGVTISQARSSRKIFAVADDAQTQRRPVRRLFTLSKVNMPIHLYDRQPTMSIVRSCIRESKSSYMTAKMRMEKMCRF